MGCGTSSGGTMTSVEKHPADTFLPHLRLARLKIPKFDEFFTNFEAPANSIIKLSNTLAGSIFGIKISTCALMGGLHVKLSAGTDHDIVLLQFAKADGTTPAADEVLLLQKKPDVKAADAKLAAALDKLMASSPTGLVASADGLDGQADFNDALKAFKAAVGAGYATKVILKSAAAVGAPTIIAAVTKPEFKGHHESAHYTPASLLDIAATKAASEVFAAQVGVAEQVHALAAASKDLSFAFGMHQNRVEEPTSEEVEDAARLAAIQKAVANFNIQAYKLSHAGFNANGEVSLAAAIVAVIKSLRAHVEAQAKEAGEDVAASIPKLTPKLDIKEDLTFDFDVDVTFSPALRHLTFPECLPPPAKHVWDMIKHLQTNIVDMVGKFAPIKDEVQTLIDQSKTTFDDAPALIGEANLPMSEAMKAPGIVKNNLTAITGLSAVFTSFTQTLKTVTDEMSAAVTEVQKLSA